MEKNKIKTSTGEKDLYRIQLRVLYAALPRHAVSVLA